MLSFILDRHSQVFAFDELHFFERLWVPQPGTACSRTWAVEVVQKLLRIQREDLYSKTPLSRFEQEANQIISALKQDELSPENVFACFLEYETKRQGKLIACEQTPLNVFFAQEIMDLYPDAKFIQMVRDPRDVMLSQKNKWKRAFLGGNGPNRSIPFYETLRAWANYHPITISQLWKNSVSAGYALKDNIRLKTIRFEDVTSNPQETIQELCRWLEIDFQPTMLKIPKVGSSISTDSSQEVGITKNTGNWLRGGLNAAEIAICDKITHEQRHWFQYTDAPVRPNLLQIFSYYVLFPFRIGLAFLLNINRMANIATSIKRRFLRK